MAQCASHPLREPTLDIAFILVEPARQENIGAAARALKTMGFRDLWLVNGPALEPAAYHVAHESGEILDTARLFGTLAEALAEVDLSIGTGARRRLEKDEYLPPGRCREVLADKMSSLARVAVVFGRESSGLTGAELALCDVASTIPLAVSQPSLNLAQAVMLYAWELSPLRQQAQSVPDASHATLTEARRRLDEALDLLDVGSADNLRHRARDLLTHCDDRDLGMLLLLLGRLSQRLS